MPFTFCHHPYRPRMVALVCALGSVALTASWHVPAAPAAENWLDAYREPASRIIGSALANTLAWDRLAKTSGGTRVPPSIADAPRST